MLFSGCIKNKNVLLKLSMGMHKEVVRSKIGQPDEIRSPIITRNGDVVDIWEYNLVTVDQDQATNNILATLGVFVICPPLAFIPAVCMKSPNSYEDYFLKFVNDFLIEWGRSTELHYQTF
jgi:hypothetical protein